MKRTFIVGCEQRRQGRPRFNRATGTAYKAKEETEILAEEIDAYWREND